MFYFPISRGVQPGYFFKRITSYLIFTLFVLQSVYLLLPKFPPGSLFFLFCAVIDILITIFLKIVYWYFKKHSRATGSRQSEDPWRA